MAKFKLAFREEIMRYSLINIIRLSRKSKLSYEERCSLVLAVMQYMFAFYAAYGKFERDDDEEDVNIVVTNFLHEFNHDEEMKEFVRDASALRNSIAHMMYLPDTIKSVNNAFKVGSIYAL